MYNINHSGKSYLIEVAKPETFLKKAEVHFPLNEEIIDKIKVYLDTQSEILSVVLQPTKLDLARNSTNNQNLKAVLVFESQKKDFSVGFNPDSEKLLNPRVNFEFVDLHSDFKNEQDLHMILDFLEQIANDQKNHFIQTQLLQFIDPDLGQLMPSLLNSRGYKTVDSSKEILIYNKKLKSAFHKTKS